MKPMERMYCIACKALFTILSAHASFLIGGIGEMDVLLISSNNALHIKCLQNFDLLLSIHLSSLQTCVYIHLIVWTDN